MKRKLGMVAAAVVAVLAVALPAYGQTNQPSPPDCQMFFTTSAATSTVNSNTLDNRQVGCTSWFLSYQSTGYTVISLTFQSAPGPVTAGTFGAYAGTLVTGINPNTSTTGAQSSFANGTVAIPWVRVNIVLTGTGTLNGVFYGYKAGASGSGGGSPGATCTVASPCVVVQSDPSLLNAQVRGTTAAGAAAPNPVVIGTRDSSANTLTAFTCDSQATITIAGAGTTLIVTGAAAKRVRICSLSFANSGASDVTVVSGTGATCGTGTSTIAGAYKSNINAFLGFGNFGPLIGVSGDSICLTFGSAVTSGGVVVYSLF